MIMDPNTMMLMVEERREELRRTMAWSRMRPIRLGTRTLLRWARAAGAGLRSVGMPTSNRAV